MLCQMNYTSKESTMFTLIWQVDGAGDTRVEEVLAVATFEKENLSVSLICPIHMFDTTQLLVTVILWYTTSCLIHA